MIAGAKPLTQTQKSKYNKGSLIDTWKQAQKLKGEPHRSSQWRYASLDCPRQSRVLRKLETGRKFFLDKNSIHYSRWIVGSADCGGIWTGICEWQHLCI